MRTRTLDTLPDSQSRTALSRWDDIANSRAAVGEWDSTGASLNEPKDAEHGQVRRYCSRNAEDEEDDVADVVHGEPPVDLRCRGYEQRADDKTEQVH